MDDFESTLRNCSLDYGKRTAPRKTNNQGRLHQSCPPVQQKKRESTVALAPCLPADFMKGIIMEDEFGNPVGGSGSAIFDDSQYRPKKTAVGSLRHSSIPVHLEEEQEEIVEQIYHRSSTDDSDSNRKSSNHRRRSDDSSNRGAINNFTRPSNHRRRSDDSSNSSNRRKSPSNHRRRSDDSSNSSNRRKSPSSHRRRNPVQGSGFFDSPSSRSGPTSYEVDDSYLSPFAGSSGENDRSPRRIDSAGSSPSKTAPSVSSCRNMYTITLIACSCPQDPFPQS